MRLTNALVLSALLMTAVSAPAQVMAPAEIRDPGMRELQTKYFPALKQITQAAADHSFPYRFYFSRVLDLAEQEQGKNDQRSVQFDQYQGKIVLKITGNYFASYSAEAMKPEERARQTYEDVMLPLLRAAVPALDKADEPQAFAFEISHHVRKKLLGVPSEGTENVVLIIPRDAARRLVAATDPSLQHAAVLEGEAFLNTAPVSFWPRPEGPIQISSASRGVSSPAARALIASVLRPEAIGKIPAPVEAPERGTSPEVL